MPSDPNPSRRPKGIIFDIGRVIIRLNLERPLTLLADSRAPTGPGAAERFWTMIQRDPLWPDWQEGRLTTHEWHAHLTRRLDLPIDLERFCAAWNSALEPETILEESLLVELGSRFRLALLSNTDPLHSAEIESRFAFPRHFPVRIYSCRIGITKPSPSIYRAALSALSLSPADALYVDDIEEFVVAARKLGIDAIRFESPAQLAAEFARRGLLDSPAALCTHIENDGAE